MNYEIHTRQFFKSGGTYQCQKCNKKTYLRENAKFILWIDSFRSMVVDALNGETIHRCGRKSRWRCDNCQEISKMEWTPIFKGRNVRPDMQKNDNCPKCREGILRQEEYVDE